MHALIRDLFEYLYAYIALNMAHRSSGHLENKVVHTPVSIYFNKGPKRRSAKGRH